MSESENPNNLPLPESTTEMDNQDTKKPDQQQTDHNPKMLSFAPVPDDFTIVSDDIDNLIEQSILEQTIESLLTTMASSVTEADNDGTDDTDNTDIDTEIADVSEEQLAKDGEWFALAQKLRLDNHRLQQQVTQLQQALQEKQQELNGQAKQLREYDKLLSTKDLELNTVQDQLTPFSNDQENLRNRFGCEHQVLPMVRVKEADGSPSDAGIALLREMVLARAFPNVEPEQRLSLITKVFDTPQTLDRLCLVSGGHVRNLLVLLRNCLKKDELPLSRNLVERVISQRRNELSRAITPDEWQLLRHVAEHKTVRGEEEYQILLKSLFVFEYCNGHGCWYDINPVLADAKELN
ncbi:hypothetical protein [Moorena sp. SIO3I6]|uniref:hypothetical protein n=1 Tax=Moorena sp. SIO3I6 TaxID=2607831 RepID=UPI0025D80461|nr:hypothetical protein [Moorena sp. SIO3I6]